MQKKTARKAKQVTEVAAAEEQVKPAKSSKKTVSMREKVEPVKSISRAAPASKDKPAKAKNKQAGNETAKLSSSKKTLVAKPVKKLPKSSTGKKTVVPAATVKGNGKPGLRSVYSNNKYTLLPLGFATDFQTKKEVVIFSELHTGQVHTVALSVWKRWKLKEVKKINTET